MYVNNTTNHLSNLNSEEDFSTAVTSYRKYLIKILQEKSLKLNSHCLHCFENKKMTTVCNSCKRYICDNCKTKMIGLNKFCIFCN